MKHVPKELLELIQSHGPQLNGIHLSAAFMTLARSKAQGVEDVLRMLLRRTQEPWQGLRLAIRRRQEVEMNAQCCAGASN